MSVLVAYSSKYGATQGIAERIAATLVAAGQPAHLHRASQVPDPEAYDAYVIGAATYMGSWLDDSRRFVESNAPLLATRPVWLFCSGPLGAGLTDSKGRAVVVSAEPREFAGFRESLHPRGVKVFSGAMDYAKLRGKDRLIRRLPSAHEMLPEGDFRDWADIDAWAIAIAHSLPTLTAPSG